MRNFEFISTVDAHDKVFGVWFFNRTPAYRCRNALIIRCALNAFRTSKLQIDEGYFVCADLSLIAISRNTLTLASSNIIRAAFPDVSNVYDIAIVLKDKIASYADWMEHLAKSSNGLPAR